MEFGDGNSLTNLKTVLGRSCQAIGGRQLCNNETIREYYQSSTSDNVCKKICTTPFENVGQHLPVRFLGGKIVRNL